MDQFFDWVKVGLGLKTLFDTFPSILPRKWRKENNYTCDLTEGGGWSFAESTGRCTTYRNRNSRIHCWELKKHDDIFLLNLFMTVAVIMSISNICPAESLASASNDKQILNLSCSAKRYFSIFSEPTSITIFFSNHKSISIQIKWKYL